MTGGRVNQATPQAHRDMLFMISIILFLYEIFKNLVSNFPHLILDSFSPLSSSIAYNRTKFWLILAPPKPYSVLRNVLKKNQDKRGVERKLPL